jgi:hypothetical protein
MRDGLRSECKRCGAIAKRARYLANREAGIERSRTWQRENRERHLVWQRRYRAANRERIQRQNRDRHLSKKYGIDSEGFELLVRAQMNLCAICLRYFGKRLHVDHDHRSGQIRGLLCGKCNKAIGLLDDHPQLAESAAKYLRRTGYRLSSGP